jgi:hypothetical protein
VQVTTSVKEFSDSVLTLVKNLLSTGSIDTNSVGQVIGVHCGAEINDLLIKLAIELKQNKVSGIVDTYSMRSGDKEVLFLNEESDVVINGKDEAISS